MCWVGWVQLYTIHFFLGTIVSIWGLLLTLQVKVREGGTDWGWGVVVNVVKKPQAISSSMPAELASSRGNSYIVDALLHCSMGTAENGSQPKPCPPCPGEEGEMHVVSWNFLKRKWSWPNIYVIWYLAYHEGLPFMIHAHYLSIRFLFSCLFFLHLASLEYPFLRTCGRRKVGTMFSLLCNSLKSAIHKAFQNLILWRYELLVWCCFWILFCVITPSRILLLLGIFSPTWNILLSHRQKFVWLG